MRNSPEIATIIQPFEVGAPDTRRPEQRLDPRWRYEVTQLAAFHGPYNKPTKEMLEPVRCHDISLGGISFYLSRPPHHTHCTLVLGRPPGLVFVKARIVHFEPAESASEDWKVGCQFLEKLEAFPLRDV